MPALLAGILLIIFAALIGLYGLWLLIPILSGLPWNWPNSSPVSSFTTWARAMAGCCCWPCASLARQATGIEISPVHCLVARLLATSQHLNDRITNPPGRLFQANLSPADIVFAYMTFKEARRRRPQLEQQLHPGARFVTISFDFDGWQPDAYDKNELIFLYTMPATPGNVATFLAKIL